MQVIGLINITNYDAAHFTTYFLKEFFRYARNSGRRIPQIIIDSITDIENKSSAYTDEFQYNKIVSVLGEEIESLVCSHSNKVAILCNVAHLYMETVLSTFSDIKPYFVDIVESAVLEAKKTL